MLFLVNGRGVLWVCFTVGKYVLLGSCCDHLDGGNLTQWGRYQVLNLGWLHHSSPYASAVFFATFLVTVYASGDSGYSYYVFAS